MLGGMVILVNEIVANSSNMSMSIVRWFDRGVG